MKEKEYIRISNKQTLMILLETQNHLLGGDFGHEDYGVSAEDCKKLHALLDGMFNKCMKTIKQLEVEVE